MEAPPSERGGDGGATKDQDEWQWHVVDAEETYHFFNAEMMLSTNDTRARRPGKTGGEDNSEGREQDRTKNEASEGDAVRRAPRQMTYEDIFPSFDDLYLPEIAGDADVPVITARRRAQQDRAAKVMEAFCMDRHFAQSYMYRKRSEYLRLCYMRALEREMEEQVGEKEEEDESKASKTTDASASTGAKQDQDVPIFRARKRPLGVETTQPALLPREWPHLPYRHPREWRDNVAAVLEFTARLAKLPEGSLVYEPIDVDAFVREACELLVENGVEVDPCAKQSSPRPTALPEGALIALAGLLAFGMHLQSFSILVFVAEKMVQHGEATTLQPYRAGFREVFESCCKRLAKFASAVVPAAMYPRALLSQWKICSYQPSTSDAIACDGTFLYVFGRAGLLKLGTGNRGTLRDYVYEHNKEYIRNREAERSWLCYIGSYLYCRTIIMPGSRIDRIPIDNIHVVEEMFFSPPPLVEGKTVNDSSVYAMVTDGKDLFSIKCIDTQKHPSRKKSRGSRSKKTPLRGLTKSASSSLEGCTKGTIRNGDRVIRGPDWKWGNQDGERGSLGTVERINSWGGVKGCGITVRWDKNQRVNTYRWGAEGCFDLIIVIEKEGKIIERKALPPKPAQPKEEVEPDLPPRHQFVVFRHDVGNIKPLISLEDAVIERFLDIAPSGRKESISEDDVEGLLSSLHSHALSLSDSPTSWMCDGGTSGCLGDDSGKRYRCESGCDYDLCEVCLRTTVIAKTSQVSLADVLAGVDSPSTQRSAEEVSGTEKVAGGHDKEMLTQEDGLPALVSAASQPETSPAKAELKESVEEVLVDTLASFWNGMFSKKECRISLRRCKQSIQEASSWLHSSSDSLRHKYVIPTTAGIVLSSPATTGALDPVLLIAGSFYATRDQLCIVAPPGLCQSEQTKRSLHASDAAWFFSLVDGKLFNEQETPVLLKGVPAGSPVCVDHSRGRILVFSGFLNCIEEYADSSQCLATSSPNVDESLDINTQLSTVGSLIFRHLRQVARKRFALPAYLHPMAGLQDALFCAESETSSTAASKLVASHSTKTRSRRIKNIRLRLRELERLGFSDRCGYIIPFCTDYDERGLFSLMQGILFSVMNVKHGAGSVTTYDALNDMIRVLADMIRELAALDIRVTGCSAKWSNLLLEAGEALDDIAHGRAWVWSTTAGDELKSLRSQIIWSAQEALLWGVSVGFFRQQDSFSILRELLNSLLHLSSLPADYPDLMGDDSRVASVDTSIDCVIVFLRRILAAGNGISNVVCSSSDAMELTEQLFKLAEFEFKFGRISNQVKVDEKSPIFSPVENALHSLFNSIAAGIFEPPKSLPADCKSNTNRKVFEHFVLVCIKSCKNVLRDCAVQYPQQFNERPLHESFVGKILPMVLAVCSDAARDLAPNIQDALVSLAETINMSSDRKDGSDDDCEVMDEVHVIESSHPYSRSQSTLRRVIRIPGASCIHLDFDRRCSTTGESDFVFIAPGHSWIQTDRTPFGDSGVGDNGGCFFGTVSKGNWPSRGLTIIGDTVTLKLCTTSQTREDGRDDEYRRWGFKCFARGITLIHGNWSEDFRWSIAHTCSQVAESHLSMCSTTASEDDTTTEILEWLDNASLRASQYRPVLDVSMEVAEGSGQVSEYVRQFEEYFGKSRRHVPEGSKECWITTMRRVLAVFIALCADSRSSVGCRSSLNDRIIECLVRIEQWMAHRVQLMKEWHFLCVDHISLEELTERYIGNKDRLLDLCKLQDIDPGTSDADMIVARLYEIASIHSKPARRGVCSFHDAVAAEISEKAQFALDRVRYFSGCCTDDISITHCGSKVRDVTRYFSTCYKVAYLRRTTDAIDRNKLQVGSAVKVLREGLRALPGSDTAVFFVTTIYRLATKMLKMNFATTETDSAKWFDEWTKALSQIVSDSARPWILRVTAVCALAILIRTCRSHTTLREGVSCAESLVRTSVSEDTSSSSFCGYSINDLAWTAFRFMTTLECDETLTYATWNSVSGSLLSIFRQSSKRDGLSCQLSASSLGYRILCMICGCTNLVGRQDVAQCWWTECLSLMTSTPVATSSTQIAAIRLLRRIMCLHKTLQFDRAQDARLTPSDEMRILVERIGELVGGIHSNKDLEGANEHECCIIVFENDVTHSSMRKAIEKVGAPDPSVWKISLDSLGEQLSGSSISCDPMTEASSSIVHRSVRCDGCNQSPLRGVRFKCFDCTNYDLCAKCYLGQTHSTDHQFVYIPDPSVSGQLLCARSNGGGIVPEVSLVGSDQWKGNHFRDCLSSFGYAVYRRGTQKECLDTAQALSELGFLTSVMTWKDLNRLDTAHDWENQVDVSFEPGSRRLSRRSSSVPPGGTGRADRSLIATFNRNAADVILKSCNKLKEDFVDVHFIVSELVSLLRMLLDKSLESSLWHQALVRCVSNTIDQTTRLLDDERDYLSSNQKFFRSMAVANLLGGLREQLRVGATVLLRDLEASLTREGVLMRYGFGNEEVVVATKSALEADKVVFLKCSTDDVQPISSRVVQAEMIQRLDGLVPTFCSLASVARSWIGSKDDDSDEWVLTTDLAVTWLRAFSWLMPQLPMLLDNQTMSIHGNLPMMLFQLAASCSPGSRIDHIEIMRQVWWQMQSISTRSLQYSYATKPLPHDSFAADDSDIFRPTASGPVSEFSDVLFNMYAYSSRSELPQHSGRNKLLEYWEKNVIPAIQLYVAGSFKSYEMDYFFAQLREPLREGNAAAAMKIAFTLCDGHIPAGCHYPDLDTDWSSLQIDDIEVGSRYVIYAQQDDVCDWMREMLWTIGHSGVARVVHPSGLVLLQFVNLLSSRLEEWWFHVDSLRLSNDIMSPTEHTVKEFTSAKLSLVHCNLQLMSVIARKCVFELLKMAPEQFSLASTSKESHDHFSLVQLLRMAASAELGCQAKRILGESLLTRRVHDEELANPILLSILRAVLSKQFDHVPAHFDRFGEEKGCQANPVVIAKTNKLVVQGPLKMATGKPNNDLDPTAVLVKYRTDLMNGLVNELKRCLEASTQFLQRNTLMVTSESPPRPMIMLQVPGATSLVISFAVHPVLMDLPSGSSLEFFRDEQCTDRVFGFFGEKRGFNYLPSLVTPGEKCYVKMTQGSYARYKFRVDPLTADFGLAIWIAEEIYQKLIAIHFSAAEQEVVLSPMLSVLSVYAVDVPLPPSVKSVVFQVLSKMINFALSRALLKVVPITKLSAIARELTSAYETELTMQKCLFSSFSQQLAELLSLIEEVSRLKGASSPIIESNWWTQFVRLATFTRVMSSQKEAINSDNAFKRVYCGRAPTQEIEIAWKTMVSRDLLSERMILIQKLPRTSLVRDLKAAISRFIIRVCMEACGEGDDQSVLSAAEVIRFGILAKVLYLPLDADGLTIGYAVVDVGREDIISSALSRMQTEKFEFAAEGTSEDTSLTERVTALSASAGDVQDMKDGNADKNDKRTWSCPVCTLKNPLGEVECTACGSAIPADADDIVSSAAPQAVIEATVDAVAGVEGWSCTACTLVNSWAEVECGACGSSRDPDLIPPETSNISQDGTSSSKSDVCGHQLSAVRVVDALRVAEESEVQQMDSFLRFLFIQDCSRLSAQPDGSTQLSVALTSALQRHLNCYHVSRESKKAIDDLAKMLGVTWMICDDSADNMLAEVCTAVAHGAQRSPFQLYRWIRGVGLDLDFETNHYTELQDAFSDQGKWTHQMDSQLINMSRQTASSIGILALVDLCPTHLSASLSKEYPLLAQLDTRNLRLRFMILKTMNELMMEALPLVNLKTSSDAMSLRARVMSMRQFIFPGVKIKFSAQTEDNANVAASNLSDVSIKRPTVTLDRTRIVNNRSLNKDLDLTIPERSLFASTMAQLSNVEPSVLRAKRPTGASDPFVSFVVIFTGENVVGEGGPYRQLFNDISNELLSSDNPLFVPTPNNAMKIGEYRERYLPRPNSTSKEMIKIFEFVGVLMGCSLRTGARLNLRLAPIVWKMLVKQPLALVDLEHIDWSFCESLKYLESSASDATVSCEEILHESFTMIRSDGSIIELKPGGMNLHITKANCKEYIRLAKHARLHECKTQVDAMLRGIGKIIPKDLLQLCVWSELQQWICGSLSIDIDLLKRHTRYSSGMTPEKYPHLNMFWAVLGSFSEEDRRRFVNFAWGQESLPADDAEFDRTHTRLLIKAPAAPDANQDLLLPKADTCFFNIELPMYSSEEVMRKKLLLAITLCTSMDGDEQTGRVDLYYGDEMEVDPIE